MQGAQQYLAMASKSNNPADAVDDKRMAYPYNSLAKVLEVGEIVAKLGGANTEIQKSLIAQDLKLDDSSATLLQVLASTRAFGVISGRGSYTLTEIGKRYFHPTADGEQRLALLTMLKMPSIYGALIDRFDGAQLVSSDRIMNILHRDHQVAESWRARVASMFVGALREAGVVDSGGFLRYKASVHAVANGKMVTMNHPTQAAIIENPLPAELPEIPNAAPIARTDMDVWSFRVGDETVRLETSQELSLTAWKKLSQYVQILKPDESEQEKMKNPA